MSASIQLPEEEEILSEQQIQDLLLQAEARLRDPAAASNDADTSMIALNPQAEAPESASRKPIPTLNNPLSAKPYVRQKDDVASFDNTRSVTTTEKTLADSIRAVQPFSSEPKKSKEKPTAGPEWFNLPKTNLTPELKRDLQLLRMRSVLDPKRHYKKESGKAKLPEYSQVGTVVEGPTEFFSSRISKKDRKKTFVEEAMATEAENHRFQRKYDEIQSAKTSGKKGHYKALQARRNRWKKFG